ncbi:transcription factor IIA, alpha/beta subunit [Myxozyma melibiosi]|uniref:Transcription factor IIA, alpha/beta subunit n=1 Tax=Myxozyma melibiosi TaxID=54550 RepID=A0ABR1F520_9ASCO
MSNSLVGDVYRDVIEDVINASRLDFEDSGISEETLRELQLLWQERLSLAGAGRFPWDPEPVHDPEPQIQMPGQQQYQQQHQQQQQQQLGALGDNVHVKYEVSSPSGNNASIYGSNMINSQVPQPFSNPAMAAMRAAQHIQEFARDEKVPTEIANASIEGVMKRAGLEDNNGDGLGGGLMLPGGGRIAQVDGATHNIEEGMSTADVDRLLELHILKRKTKQSDSTSEAKEDPSIPSGISIKRSRKSREITFTICQADGPMDSDSDEDEDEEDDDDLGLGSTSAARRKAAANADDSDAINSDLDDSEDELNSNDEDDSEESGMLMLCLYDRVSRTKNKWKCVLKDGVVNVNGKDYIFGKGTGEYEW